VRRLVLLAALLATAAAEARAQDPATSPNLVVVFVDDLGYGDLGSYGHPTIRTPHLDRLAAEGMRFTQFYVAASVCTPSRAALLTGRYPVRRGMVQGLRFPGRVLFPGDESGLPSEEVTIAELLRDRGYATAAVGKWHLGHLPRFLPTAHGFDRFFGLPYSNDMDWVSATEKREGFWNVPLLRDTTVVERPVDQSTITRRYTEEAVRFIRERSDGPFFLYLAHTMPHIPLFTSQEFVGVSSRGLYGDVVEELDWSMGRIREALEDEGIERNTLVLFISDNGPWLVQETAGGSSGLLRDGKGTTWEGGMRVPMIAWWPGTVPAGRSSRVVATTMDLLPTAAALAGSPLPDRVVDGRDLGPVLRGEAESHLDFFVYYRGAALYAARLGPWKAHFITQGAYPDPEPERHDPPLLYHLEHDPGERYDVADENPDVLAAIRDRVAAHEASVGVVTGPAIEAEALIDGARVTGGSLRVQDMSGFDGEWSGAAQLWWVEAVPGNRLTLPLQVPSAGPYELIGFFTRAGDYGIIRLQVDGRVLRPLVDGYAAGVEPSGAISFGPVELPSGTVEVVVELLGKDARSAGYSDGYLVGIDGFTLRPVSP
jgi:arylsulfatase A